jgi:hypothetical protein
MDKVQATPDVEEARQALAKVRGIAPGDLEYIGECPGSTHTPGAYNFNIMDKSHPNYLSTIEWPKEKEAKASILDYPQAHLDPAVFDLATDPPRLKEKVRKEVVDRLFSFWKSLGIADPEKWVYAIYADGSELTYQWRKTSDFDVYVLINWEDFKSTVPMKLSLTPAQIATLLTNINRNQLDGKPITGTNHPVTYYVRPDHGIQGSDAIYDLLTNQWVKSPEHLSVFDPEEKFGTIWNEAQAIAKLIDINTGEVKRDLVDYERIKEYLSGLDREAQDWLLGKLEVKISEIDSGIGSLLRKFEEVHEERKKVYMDPGEKASWQSGNVIWKFLERYGYVELLHELKKALKGTGGEVKTHEDVVKVEEVLDKKAYTQQQVTQLMNPERTRQRIPYIAPGDESEPGSHDEFGPDEPSGRPGKKRRKEQDMELKKNWMSGVDPKDTRFQRVNPDDPFSYRTTDETFAWEHVDPAQGSVKQADIPTKETYKFVPDGIYTLYHATPKKNVKSILKEGLRRSISLFPMADPVVWLGEDPQLAFQHAQKRNPDSDIVVLQVQVDMSKIGLHKPVGHPGFYNTHEIIPPEVISVEEMVGTIFQGV